MEMVMMERNNEKINALRKGIKRLTNELDEQWRALEHFLEIYMK